MKKVNYDTQITAGTKYGYNAGIDSISKNE